MKRKIIFLVFDGLADAPITALGRKTPLEAGRTPNFDLIATKGACGMVRPFTYPGKLPTSEDSHLALFGYDPKRESPGRGVLEALGARMDVQRGDVCFRANFATVDDHGKVQDRRAGRVRDTSPLIRALSRIRIPGVKFFFKQGTGHRFVILMRGSGLSSQIRGNDEKKTGIVPPRIRPLARTKEAKHSAEVLNEFLRKAHLACQSHAFNRKRSLPANYILMRGAGSLSRVQSFRSRHGLSAACVAGGGLYKGIGQFLGMDVLQVKGANALPTTNIRGKFQRTVRSLRSYDFVFCHVKAADNLAEDGDYMAKKRFLEKADSFLPILLKDPDATLVVTGDHATCSSQKSHCADEIPVAITGPRIRSDHVERFSEHHCIKGDLRSIKQMDVMRTVLDMST